MEKIKSTKMEGVFANKDFNSIMENVCLNAKEIKFEKMANAFARVGMF